MRPLGHRIPFRVYPLAFFSENHVQRFYLEFQIVVPTAGIRPQPSTLYFVEKFTWDTISEMKMLLPPFLMMGLP